MLKISQVHTHYGPIHALKGVDLEVAEGEIVSMIGANGAGKSTILRTISGLVEPTSGTVEFMGKKINGLMPKEIVKLGISHCPEERKIWPLLTVSEHLELGAYLRSGKESIRADAEVVYDYFPVLRDRKNQLAGTLSGGEQQMLAIGRALMSRPKLMLFDEPSLGLAPLIVEQMANIIQDIHRSGTTLLLVEQNAFLALNLADRGYVLETGRVTLFGDAKGLLNDPKVKKAYLGHA